MDLNMPVMNGLDFVQTIRDENIDINILVVSMLDDIKNIKKMLNMGIQGYILTVLMMCWTCSGQH